MHKRKLFILFAVFCLLLFCSVSVYAESKGELIIDDRENLLSDAQEELLRQKMEPITAYGGVAFVTDRQYSRDTGDYAETLYRSYFGRNSGTLFLIDMGQRNIWIFSDGAIYRTITKAYANTITDNVYRYATRGDYYGCAAEVFDEMLVLLEGGRIAQPMKYICNAFIALILGLLSNFIYLLIQRSRPKTNSSDAVAAMTSAVGVSVIARDLVKSHRSRHVESSGGGGGGGGSGGGGGGGGSSGGGGGHSF